MAKALETEKPDLVLTGLQSDDLGYGQTGVILAAPPRMRTPQPRRTAPMCECGDLHAWSNRDREPGDTVTALELRSGDATIAGPG